MSAQTISHRSAPGKRKLIWLLPAILALLAAGALALRIQFAKTTYLIRDGEHTMTYHAAAKDPNAVLEQAGIRLGSGDYFTTQPHLLQATELTVYRQMRVSLTVNALPRAVFSYGETVGALLERLNISYDEDDRLSCSPDAQTYDNMVISLVRVDTETVTYDESIPFSIRRCEDASMEAGDETILTPGADGTVRRKVRITYEDGKEVGRETLSETVLTPATQQLVLCGVEREAQYRMSAPPVTQTPVPKKQTASQPVETTAAPEPETTQSTASEESSNTITTAGGETLTYSRVLSCSATAYSCDGRTAYTATGTVARVGAIAVDPSVIPYGTRMYIVSEDGAYVYGYATAEDCGGAIQGNKIDLYFNTTAECYTFGRRTCKVYILS